MIANIKEQPGRKAVIVLTEKTAGTSVRRDVEEAVGKKHVAVWRPEAKRLAKSSDIFITITSPLLNEVRLSLEKPVIGPVLANLWSLATDIYRNRVLSLYPELIVPEDTYVILGHITATQFDGLIQNPFRAVVLRNPLERAMAHYDQLSRHRGRSEDGRIPIPYKPGMTFEQFALLDEVQNYQAQAIAGIPLKAFDVVGVTERLDEFTQTLLQRLGTECGITLQKQENQSRQKQFNKTPSRRDSAKYYGTPFVEIFQKRNADDYDLYYEALRM